MSRSHSSNDDSGLPAVGPPAPRPEHRRDRARPARGRRTRGTAPFDEIRFGQVQRWVERTADDLMRDLRHPAFAPEDPTHDARAFAPGPRADVELAGMQAFDRARRVHADDRRSFPWKAHALKAMQAKVTEIFGDEASPSSNGDHDGGDEGLGGTPSLRPMRPGAPGGGEAIAKRRGRRTAARPAAFHRQALLRSRTELAVVAERMATGHVRAVIGSWSDDSEAVDHVARSAAAGGLDRWERLWDPEKGSLLGYLSDCVKSKVRDEYRGLCDKKSQDNALKSSLEEAALDELRFQVYAGRAPDGHDAPTGSELQLIVAAVDELSKRQRAAVLRRLETDDPGSQADSNAYSRAVKQLRERLGQTDDTAGARATDGQLDRAATPATARRRTDPTS